MSSEFVDVPLVKSNKIEARPYQETIYMKSKDSNSLVVLPTGLGKTLIAVMVIGSRLDNLNGKALFLAPTKPLVLQHLETLEENLEIDNDNIEHLTGEISPEDRKKIWEESKIIVATPQTIENDLMRGISLKNVVITVFDESHRATGDYSYVYLAKKYMEKSKDPQIMGLTASPGSGDKIEEVMDNLFIENIEARHEDSYDVKPFVEEKDIQWNKIELPQIMKDIKTLMNQYLKDVMKRLKNRGFVDSAGISNLKKRDLFDLKSDIQQKISNNPDPPSELFEGMKLQSSAFKTFTAVEKLETQGIRSYKDYIKKLRSERGKRKSTKELLNDKRVKKALKKAQKADTDHPKMDKVHQLVTRKFSQEAKKIIVFSHYRDTAKRIKKMLKWTDGVKPKEFIGQSDNGMSQKEQKEAIKKFKQGKHNVLVATSVGEEGLDIPEVDVVIFYEPVPSAIRSIQRRGRTGRTKSGEIIVLMTKNTRDEAYYWSSKKKEKKMKNTIKKLSTNQGKSIQTSLGQYSEKSKENKAKNNEKTKEKPAKEEKESKKKKLQFEFGSKEPKIYIDNREMKSKVVRNLRDLEAELEIQKLDLGDYILSKDVIIERKSAEDFLSSLMDNRLFEQSSRLVETYRNPIIILEGSPYGIRDIHPNAIRGAISSLILDYGIPVLYSRNQEDTASLIYTIAKREQEDEEKEISVRGDQKKMNIKERQRYIVEGLPHISSVLAKRLLTHFGSVEAIYSASKNELQKVEGIGEKIADEIHKIINAPYETAED